MLRGVSFLAYVYLDRHAGQVSSAHPAFRTAWHLSALAPGYAWAAPFGLAPEFASLPLMVVLRLTVDVPGNNVVSQSDSCPSRQSHAFQGAAIGGDFTAMPKVVAALMGTNEAFEVGRGPGVSAIVDSYWTARGRIVC
jgi:hypothetical protein